jgi:hypothetical protein
MLHECRIADIEFASDGEQLCGVGCAHIPTASYESLHYSLPRHQQARGERICGKFLIGLWTRLMRSLDVLIDLRSVPQLKVS